MELITTSPDIRLSHCFLKFSIRVSHLQRYQSPEQALEQILQGFNTKMRAQLSEKGTSTPGKIMHTKVFQEHAHAICQIRCYFALSQYEGLDWQ